MDNKRIKTSTWIIVITAILLVCLGLSIFIFNSKTDGTIANVYVDGECVYSVDLQTVTDKYDKTIVYEQGGENVLTIENGKICVSSADCPDGVCIRSGWISDSLAPIVCLPHRLVIKVEKESAEGKAITDKFKSDDATKNSTVLFAMDTVMDITIYGDRNLLDGVEEIIKSNEEMLSTTVETSDIYRLNVNKSTEVSAKTGNLIDSAYQISMMTDGALDITVYPLVKAWGFTTGDYKIPEDKTIQNLLNYVNYQDISISQYNEEYDTYMVDIMNMGNWFEEELDGEVYEETDEKFDRELDEETDSSDEGVLIDLGSIAKGYTGDCIVDYLKQKGVSSAVLNLGGNVQTIGSKPDGSAWRVAVKDPINPNSSILGYVDVIDKCVITSGDYERFFEQDGKRYHHIIDPKTGYPADNGLKSVTVVGDDGTICDGLSTALFVMGKEKALELWRRDKSFDVILFEEDGSITLTEGLIDNFVDVDGHSVTVVK